MHQELAYREQDDYGYEWDDFAGKNLVDKESFKKRRFLIDNSEVFQEEKHTELKSDLENWLKIDEMKEGECLRISGKNLRKYIDPYELTKCKETHFYPGYIVLANLVSSFLPEDKNLVFHNNGTVISQNNNKVERENAFEVRTRIMDESFDLEGGYDFKRGANLLSWYEINNMGKGELLCVSDANLKKLIDLESVFSLLKNDEVVPYREYVVLAGLLGSFLPKDRRLAFSSNPPSIGTFITI